MIRFGPRVICVGDGQKPFYFSQYTVRRKSLMQGNSIMAGHRACPTFITGNSPGSNGEEDQAMETVLNKEKNYRSCIANGGYEVYVLCATMKFRNNGNEPYIINCIIQYPVACSSQQVIPNSIFVYDSCTVSLSVNTSLS